MNFNTRGIVKYLITYIVMYMMLLTSGHVLSIAGKDVYLPALLVIVVLLPLKLLFTGNSSIRIYSNDIYITLLFIGMLIVEFVSDAIYGYSINYSLKFGIVLLMGFLITRFFSFEEFMKCYTNIITFFSGISIIGFLIGMVNGFFYSLPVFTNINGVSYYNGYLFFSMDDYSRGRNIGIFWEPGIFSIMITLAVLFLVFNSVKINKTQLILLILALVSTYSTTGYVLLSVIALALIFVKKNQSVALKVLGVLFFVVGIVLLLIGGDIQPLLIKVAPRVFNKIFLREASTTARIDSIVYNLKLFSQNILGSGITKTNYLFQNLTLGSQTSTMTLYLAQFGLLGVIFVVMQIVGIINCKLFTRKQSIIFLMFWIISMNVEIMTMFSIVYVLFYYFLENIDRHTHIQ